jgi:hypothetical protein
MLKNQLLSAAIRRSAEVTIDGVVYTVRELSAAEFAEYGRVAATDRDRSHALILAAGLIEDDAPILTLEEARTVALSARVALPLVNAIMVLSGFGPAEKESDAS